MKHSLAGILLVAACGIEDVEDMEAIDELATSEQALNGDTWITSDLLQPSPHARPSDVTFGSDHQVFVVGSKDSGTRWSFRTSTNGGITYANGPTYSLAPGKEASAAKIGVDATGRIVVTGTAVDALDRPHWVTRISTDQGATFTTVNDQMFQVGTQVWIASLAIDAAGNLTIAGVVDDATVLKRAKPGFLYWGTLANPASNARIRGLCTTAGGELFATGQTTVFGTTGVTYRYAGSGSWTVLDTFASPGEDGGTACTESSGALYVGGRLADSWIVRRSTNGGATWTTVDSVSSPTYGPIADMGPGRDGRTYIVGQRDDGGNPRWAVRRTSNGTTWLDSDLPTTGVSAASGYAFDPVTEDATVVGFGVATGVRRLD